VPPMFDLDCLAFESEVPDISWRFTELCGVTEGSLMQSNIAVICVLSVGALLSSQAAFAGDSASCDSPSDCESVCASQQQSLNADHPNMNYTCTISEMNSVEVIEGEDDDAQTTMSHTTYNCLCTPGAGSGDGSDGGDGGSIIFPGGARRPKPIPVPPDSDYASCVAAARAKYERQLADCRSNYVTSLPDGTLEAIESIGRKDQFAGESKTGWLKCETDMSKILQEDLRVCNNKFLKRIDGWKDRWTP